MNFLEVKNLFFSYQDSLILEDISFALKKGEITALIGPNGSGKTTLVKNILGLLKPDKGEVFLAGTEVSQVINKIGYVPQKFDFDRQTPITLYEFLSLEKCGKSGHDCANIDFFLEKVSLADYKYQKISSLSGGQFQRAMIARALLHEKELLIFDEPSTGIDLAGEKTVYDLILAAVKEKQVTCLIISHDLNIVNNFMQKVICLNRKIICQGTPKKVINNKIMDQLYGLRAEHQH